MGETRRFRNFGEFYPYYLSEHENRVSRRLHFCGTSVAVLLLGLAVLYRAPYLVLLALLQGYALAWVGAAVGLRFARAPDSQGPAIPTSPSRDDG